MNSPNMEEGRRTLHLLFQPGETIELRCVGNGPTINGYYRDFDKLAQAAPAKVSIRYGKGVLLAEAGRGEEAKGEFRWAIGIDENNWLYWRDYGRALRGAGEHERGIANLEKAIGLVRKIGDPVTAREIEAELAAARGGSGG